MAASPNEITFIVSGKEQTTEGREPVPSEASVRSAVRVGARRGNSDVVRLTANVDTDIVRLHIANGPTLYLHPAHASELLRAQVGGTPETRRDGGGVEPGVTLVPSQLGWSGLPAASSAPGVRGGALDLSGEVIVEGIDIVKGVVVDQAAKFVGSKIVEKVDSQVDPGVYQLTKESLEPLKGRGTLAKIPRAADDKASLVLIHGTFSNTAGTFSKLWQSHPDLVARLFSAYQGRVFGLEHHTLGDNPFANALLLVNELAPGATLHLLTHSRGGLVAEALARVCSGLGTSAEDLALFDDAEFAEYRRDLVALAAAVNAKKIKVERVVRVACPIRGTLLASRRLDAFLSVFKWGLQSAGIPVLPQIVDFIGEVARRRAKPEELPGLEVQMPGSSFTKWANVAGHPVDGDLRVVAGDVQGDSVVTWLKTLLTDAFYWTDHDLVVQTRSMYGGSPRNQDRAKFILDRGSKVNHFNYFTNDRTANMIALALMEESVDQFRPIGPLSWAGEDSGGLRGAVVAPVAGAKPTRPAIFVLPGILGSHLKVGKKRVWLSLRFINNLDDLQWNAASPRRVTGDGLIGSSYDDFVVHLGKTYEVIPFSYDWRAPLEGQAELLADQIDAAMAARKNLDLPVHIVAHSMGGLLARTVQLVRKKTWDDFIQRPGARFLMLGTPNAGSFAPMQVMSGDDTFGNLFTMFGSLFDGVKARQLVAGMPGLLQLQAGLLDPQQNLGSAAAWKALADADKKKFLDRIEIGAFWHREPEQMDVLTWGLPTQAALDQAVKLRRRLDEQVRTFGADTAHMALVVGQAKATPTAVTKVDGDVVYLDTPLGDGRVTLDSARLPGVRTWKVNAVHGDLAAERDAFVAYVEILAKGDTGLLTQVDIAPGSRGAADPNAQDTMALTPSRPSRTLRANVPPPTIGAALADQPEKLEPESGSGVRLSVGVINGNLKFVRTPLLIGHYASLKLTGAERVVDDLIGGSMAQSLNARLYPTNVGSNQIFTNLRPDATNPYAALPRPEAVIVVGLGDEGDLPAAKLSETVRQGVIAYAQRVAEIKGGGPTTFDLASTLIGSGGIKQSVESSAQAITIGVRQANVMLAEVGWPTVARLQLIELYLDRAADALNSLRALSGTDGKDVVVEPCIEEGPGRLLRPTEFGYRGADYDMVSVYEKRIIESVEHLPDPEDPTKLRTIEHQSTVLEFELSTNRARDEVRGSIAQSQLVDNLVKTGANVANDDPRIGRTLFKLLVPIELEPYMANSGSLQLKLDSKTAAYPWEMLDLQRDERSPETLPWGIKTRLLRKLRTSDFRENPRASDGGVLVIGEPQCPETYPRLPGAAAEAQEVAKELGAVPLLQKDAMAVTNAVFERSYSILHVAGHGDIINGVGGIVLSSGMTFGAREIKAMRIVPDLAFINCCHLGHFPGDPDKRRPEMPKGLPAFAANVAEELIKIGVRCVVAAGWAVDDDAALLFSRTFYRELKNGRRFADAVALAREVTYTQIPRSNTWAAYQCYGDENWTYGGASGGSVASSAQVNMASEFGLLLRIEHLIADHQYNDYSEDYTRDALANLLANVGNAAWLERGNVAAAFGKAYGEVGDFASAVKWYLDAVQAKDGSAGLKALEQLGNMQSRLGEKLYRDDSANRADALKMARDGIETIFKVSVIAPTSERESLLGSAYKRLAEIEDSPEAARAALLEAHKLYVKAEDAARQGGGPLFYPALNSLNLELRLRWRGDQAFDRWDEKRLAAIGKSLQDKNRDDPDFWSVIGATELKIYLAAANGKLEKAVDGLVDEFRDAHKRVKSGKQWDSVAFQTRVTLRDYANSKGLPKSEVDAAERLVSLLPKGEAKSDVSAADGKSDRAISGAGKKAKARKAKARKAKATMAKGKKRARKK